jgi:hypothetical protein
VPNVWGNVLGFLKCHWKKIVFIVTLLVADLALAYSGTSIAPTYHLDGAFQTLSGLNRLLQGDAIGKDFIPYLGTGPILIVFGAFIAFGGNLVASVIAAKLLSVAISQAIVYFIFKQFYASSKTSIPMIATLLFTFLLLGIYNPDLGQLTQLLRGNEVYETVLAASQPGWSLRPIRASAPYVFIAILLMLRKYSSNTRRPYYAIIALAIITATWSNDYAIPTALVFLVQQLHSSVITKRFAHSAKLLFTFAVSWFLTICLYTAGHPFEIIKYNFSDVPSTQFWYFGPWLGNTRVQSPSDLFHILSKEGVWLSLVLLFGLAAFLFISRQKGLTLLFSAGLVTFLGGLVATVGGHAGGYFWSFKFWSYLVICAAGLLYGTKFLRGKKIEVTRLTVFLGFISTLVISLSILLVTKDFEKKKLLADSPDYFYSTEAGGYMPKDFANLAQGQKHNDLIEEYFGISSMLHNYEAGGIRVDSIIHALGSEREKYENTMRTYRGAVITTSPSMDGGWTSWNFSANWWFYKNLILRFTPRETSPNTITWMLDPDVQSSIRPLPLVCNIDPGQKKIVFNSKLTGLYELQIKQTPEKKPLRSFAMIENNINFAGDSNAYLSISPTAETITLPVHMDGLSQLDIKTVGNFKLDSMRSCSLSEVNLSSSQSKIYQQFFGVSLLPVQLTDSNWTRGFNNLKAGFFVSRKRENLLIYKNVEKVEFTDGESRRVERVEIIDSYINVWLEGPQFTKNQGDANFQLVLKDGSVVR